MAINCNNSYAMTLSCSAQRTTPPLLHKFDKLKLSLSSSIKPFLRDLRQKISVLQINNNETIKHREAAHVRLLDAVVDGLFQFVDDPLLPSQSNFGPVEEIGEAVHISNLEGRIPEDFPEGVYIRNGSNPTFGGFKSVVSVFGKTSYVWIEGEGMLHALYFDKDSNGKWTTIYTNKYVETSTFKIEKHKNKPCILPAVEGDPPAVILSFLLNLLRFGTPNKYMSNTNIIEHAGKFYSIAENYLPQEIDIHTLETLGDWDINGTWTRPFTSHPKRAPGTGELVTMGVNAQKPYYEVGVVSADGKKLIHKVDLKFNRSTLSHEIGVTERYNVILDFPLIVDINRVLKGGSLIKYEKERYARIGIMPRYGDANSIKWFPVDASIAFHIINCFEDGDEVIVMACRAQESIIPGPALAKNKLEWFSRGFKHINFVQQPNNYENTSHDHELMDGKLFSRAYVWRLNMKTGEVKGGHLTGTDFAVDFPMINPNFTGLKNKFAYVQVLDSSASTTAGKAKYGGLAKLYIEERMSGKSEGQGKGKADHELIRIEYHMFPESIFCSGSAFVAKSGAVDEDDGWIITFVHNEHTHTSQVYIVDTKQFSREPVAKITILCRVPYGFHGIFTPTSRKNKCT